MAASTISHNTPAAGSITWTAFNIAYNGVGYAVPAGSTAGRFVWWEYRNGTPAVMTGDVLPNLGPDDTVLFLNKGGIGQLLPETTVVDGSLIVEESILASAIGAEQINGGHIEAGSIDTPHLAAGSVTADQLSVGTVSANLVANGSFEDFDADGSIIGWELSAMTNGVVQPVTGVASSGAVAIQFDATTTAANLRLRQDSSKFIPVSSASGRRWYVSARMGAGTATTTGSYIRVNWYDGNRVFLSSTDVRANGGLSTTWSVYEGQVTPPSTARFLGLELMLVSPNVVTKMYVDEATVQEVLVAAHIGDGQISTPKLAAQAVTADKILISDWTNYWSNPDFEGDGSGASPRGMTSATTHRVKDISAMNTGNGSARALEIDAKNGSNNDVFDLNTFAVKPGDQFYVRFQGRHLNTTGTGATGIGFRTYDAKKVGVTWTRVADFGATKTTTWTEIEGVYTVPDGTYFLQPWATFANNAETTNKFYVDNVVVRRMAGGELIVDGAIDGMVITGATIRTAESGARVELNEAGVEAFDTTGARTVYISASDGSFSGTGNFTAKNAKGLVALTPSTQIGGGRPGVVLGEDSASVYGPMLFGVDPTKTASDGFTPGDAALVSGQGVSDSKRSQLVLMQDGQIRLQAMGGPLNGQGFYLDEPNGITVHAPKVNITGSVTMKHHRAEFTTTNWWIEGGQSWDTGWVTPDTGSTARTWNNDFCAVGPYAGSIKFTRAGFYEISCFIIPVSGNPGTGWARLNHSNGENLVQAANAAHMWETYLHTVPVYFGVDQYVRTQCVYQYGHNVNVRWKVIRHPY